jgi:hypothetical protein
MEKEIGAICRHSLGRSAVGYQRARTSSSVGMHYLDEASQTTY